MHNPTMLASYLMLDLGTTGGNPALDRIIEIAAVRVEEGREVLRWSTLVNPGTRISSFIAGLTGPEGRLGLYRHMLHMYNRLARPTESSNQGGYVVLTLGIIAFTPVRFVEALLYIYNK